MRNFTGYFLLESKLGGLTRKPWTLSPLAPSNQKDSREDMEIWERTESLTRERGRGFGTAHWGSGSLDSPRNIALVFSRPITQSPGSAANTSVGAPRDILVKRKIVSR